MGENSRPERPPGETKPLLEEDIAPVLARLDAWYAAHLPPDEYMFNPPATDAQLDAFEHLIGLEMPGAFRQLYRWHDGEEDDRSGHFYGLPLLSLHSCSISASRPGAVRVYCETVYLARKDSATADRCPSRCPAVCWNDKMVEFPLVTH